MLRLISWTQAMGYLYAYLLRSDLMDGVCSQHIYNAVCVYVCAYLFIYFGDRLLVLLAFGFKYTA